MSHREWRSRASSFLSGFLQLHVVHSLEGVGLVEAYYRHIPLEQVCPQNKVQDGDQSVDLEGRLDGLHRPDGCLSSGPAPSRA